MWKVTQPRIFRARISDADAIHQVLNGVAAEGGPERNGIEGLVTPDSVAQWMRDLGDRGALFVARVGERGVGAAALEPAGEPGAARLRVWVLPAYRRQGIGTELGRVATQLARDLGYVRVLGHIPEQNEAALSYFSSVAGLENLQPGLRFELPLA
ncbi:MAG TPA: GNAT family N-acetyltransferase [Dehalococcoidia bacterium]|nr:GNAT family N-acetyltransferase [Dehalococcoidia bacterium]